MKKYDAGKVRQRTEYIRYIYANTDKYPTAFECFSSPIAVYDRDGIIVGANKIFRELAGLTEDDLRLGRASFYDCLNSQNAGLVEAAHNVFSNTESILQNLDRPLRAKTESADYQVARLPNVVFFPMTNSREGVEHAAILLEGRDESDLQ